MANLILTPPEVEKNKMYTRPGFKTTAQRFVDQYIAHPAFEPPPHLVYEAAKLNHSGFCSYKVFENCGRSVKKSSLANLISSPGNRSDFLGSLIQMYKSELTEEGKSRINQEAAKNLSQEEFDKFMTFTRQSRRLNASQSRKIRSMSEKLAYYSSVRKFTSKKSGVFKFKVAFLTLTSPESATPEQILKAFETFLDYLARTANCRYVWKKELGDTNHHLHFHLLINNFVPFYIISWKWKRALIGAGVVWPQNQSGKDSSSHYRIELPRSRRQVAHYISKYLSKAYELPGNYGYLAGWSRVLSSLKETTVFQGEYAFESLRLLSKEVKRIAKDFVSFYCVNLLTVKEKFPDVFEIFNAQYMKFNKELTLPQVFSFV